LKKICVFGAASTLIDKVYLDAAYELGCLMAEQGYGLVFGGGRTGIMGAVADGVFSRKGYIEGVVPDYLNVEGVIFQKCDSLEVTKTLHERNRIMESWADAFIAAPGGLGTFEELIEMTVLKQLSRHEKAVVVLNTEGYYDPLFEMFDNAARHRFVDEDSLKLYSVADTPAEALKYIGGYEPRKIQLKKIKEMQ